MRAESRGNPTPRRSSTSSWRTSIRSDATEGIAYFDEDRLTVEGVTFTLGPPGKGGMSWDDQGKMISGEDGDAVETLRFPE